MLWLLGSLIGLVVGSFLNVVIVRLPQMILFPQSLEDPKPVFNLAMPGSHCPACRHPLAILDNIPLLSYLCLRGRCRYCKKNISCRYPLVEALTALLSGFLAAHYGWTMAALTSCLLTWALIALAFIDAEHLILPDEITLSVLWIGLLLNSLGSLTSLSSLYSVISPCSISAEEAIWGAVLGYLLPWAIYWIFKLFTKKEGMGYGDFKLLALLGAWLGWQAVLLTLFFASVLGSCIGLLLIFIKKRDRSLPLPFGPFLCIGGWVSMLWGNTFSLLL